MKIIKVLNNSLVLVLDDYGAEKILMGKGIGFHKSIGDVIEEKDVEKAFVTNDDAFTTNILRLANSIDVVYFELAKEVIDIAKNEFQMELLDYLYLALADHFSFIVTRHKNKMVIPSYIDTNLQHFYPDHFKVAYRALEKLQPYVEEKLDEHEARVIALHFINAQAKPNEDKLMMIEKSIQDILNIVKYSLKTDLNHESVAYSRFVTHLSYFLTRVFKDEVANGIEMNLYHELTHDYPLENSCVDRIEVYLSNNFGVEVSLQERVYLVIHIHRLILESEFRVL